MRALVQRVTQASVSIDGETIGEIGTGLLIFACAMDGDDEDTPAKLAGKTAKLRIFPDETGRMSRSLVDTGGAALVVSQFTLAADTSRGNRPGFSAAAVPETGARYVRLFADCLERLGVTVARGRFGADMEVTLVNDGPCTIWLETD